MTPQERGWQSALNQRWQNKTLTMNLILKIFRKFVMLDTSIFNYEVFITNFKTERKILGRHTDESSAVLSKPRFGVSSSDLPSFINQNYNVMLDTNGQQNLSVLRKSWAVAELQVSYKPKTKTGVTITGSEDAYQVFRHMWDDSLINIQEQFAVLYLNFANEVIGFRVISTGSVSSNTVDTHLVLSCALISRASHFIVAHNHPSGRLRPSEADNKVTLALKEAAQACSLTLHDHLIISDKTFFSYADNGLIL